MRSSDLHDNTSSQNGGLIRCIHINCQSVKNKKDELDIFFSSLNLRFHFIMLSETWYSDCTVPWCPAKYECFARSRMNSRGGGVSLIVCDSFNVNCVQEFSCVNDDYEVLSVLHARTVYSVIYRPPRGNLQGSFSFLRNY